MSRQYNPRQFLRHAANFLVQEYFHKRGLLLGLGDFPGKEKCVGQVYDAWQALPQADRVAVERDFRAVDDLATEAGVKALVAEGLAQGLDLAREFDGLEGHHSRALWAFLRHPLVFELASLFAYVEGMRGRHWARHACLPNLAPDTTEGAVRVFADELSELYLREQGRGHRCTVEHYLRDGHAHYFFAYPDDYAETYTGHCERGTLQRRPQQRAFEVVFVYDDRDGSLDLYASGERRLKEELRALFCRVVLGNPPPPQPFADPAYDLDRLLDRPELPTDPGDGIEEVRVRLLRLSITGTAWRVILESHGKGGPPDDLYDLIARCLRAECLRPGAVRVTQAAFALRFSPFTARRRQLQFEVSAPDNCTLKSLPEEDRLLGEKYLRRWGIARG